MNIVFATAGLKFDGSYLDTKSLGGSETALASVARELARLGHDVRVFCNCDTPGEYDGVRYFDASRFETDCQYYTVDVLVVSRFGQFWKPNINGSLNVYWLHDMPGDKKDFMPFALKSDIIFTLSKFHTHELLEKAKCDVGKVTVQTKNGVDYDLIQTFRDVTRYRNTFLYSSLPERGLHHLLAKIWPRVLERIPNSELRVAGYDISSVQSLIPQQTLRLREECEQIMKEMPGVTNLGRLTKHQLYTEMRSATALLYPCIWPEVFCITAVEAQANGLPVITSNKFALSETVSPDGNYLVGGAGESYCDEFLDAIVDVNNDFNNHVHRSQKLQSFVRTQGYDWKKIALEWEKLFVDKFKSRLEQHPARMISSMLRAGDNLLAEHVDQVTVPPVNGDFPPALELLAHSPDDLAGSKILDDVDKDAVYKLVFDLWKYERPLDVIAAVEQDPCGDRKSPIRVLDLGDDSGGFAKYLTEKCKGRIEINTSSVVSQYATYDLVFAGSQIANTRYPDECIKALQKMIVPTGRIIVATPTGRVAFNELKAKEQLWNLVPDDLDTLTGNLESHKRTPCPLFIGDRGERLGFWVTTFGQSGKPQRIDLDAKMTRYRPDQTLSVAMIAKDEERWITMCLHELKGIADEILICDCNSTDRTVEMAKAFGADVTTIDFEDFASARNAVRDRVRGDWYLWIDCDERLVNGQNIRAYLECEIANSFTIGQNHLNVDDKTRQVDTPNRLVRNLPQFRFVGAIHEHCVDTSPTDVFYNDISPSYHIADVQLAHYGYVHEVNRRKKCLLRNMELLIKDARENLPKGRRITWILAMRDYINAVKWHWQAHGSSKVVANAYEHYLLNSVCDTYHTVFRNRIPELEDIARGFYDEAMTILGQNQVPYSSAKSVPFQVGLFLSASPTPEKNIGAVQPRMLWFCHPSEVREFMDRQSHELTSKWFKDREDDVPLYTWDFNPGCPNPVDVLTEIREKYKRG